MTDLARLAWTEAKLFAREPLVSTFVFGFPIITVLILGGVFDEGDTAFEGAIPADYYVAGYIGVVIAAIGLIMLPVHLASYRERGVIRRFNASHYPRWALPTAWAVVGMAFSSIAIIILLITGKLVYNTGNPETLGRLAVGGLLSMLAFVSIGLLLGMLLPSARSAQGLGLMLFFPSFLLGGGGPPPEAMGSTLQTISNLSPLTHAIRAVQEPWLGIGGSNTDHLIVLASVLAGTTAGWLALSLRTSTAE